jgi:DNA helicase II / ATP-dependent DNA helicase PcrA
MVRIESPNSINVFKQCPRKYYYSYKLKLPRKDSIATLTGKAVHDAAEHFYKLGLEGVSKENYRAEFRQRLMSLFNDNWQKIVPDLLKLGIETEVIKKHYEDSFGMLENFFSFVIDKLHQRTNTGKTFEEAFEEITPATELYLKSPTYKIQGYVDAIHKEADGFHILDYKTSKRDHVSPDYRRQLAIYALVYQELHGVAPSRVGLLFLRAGTHKDIAVNENLLLEAKKDCEWIHTQTGSDHVDDYPKRLNPLCKWKTGQCDFYDSCFEKKE